MLAVWLCSMKVTNIFLHYMSLENFLDFYFWNGVHCSSCNNTHRSIEEYNFNNHISLHISAGYLWNCTNVSLFSNAYYKVLSPTEQICYPISSTWWWKQWDVVQNKQINETIRIWLQESQRLIYFAIRKGNNNDWKSERVAVGRSEPKLHIVSINISTNYS